MLFLLNERILDLGSVNDTLSKVKGGLPPGGLTPVRAVALGREAAFAAGGLQNAKEDMRQLVGAALVAACDANAAVFVLPVNARGPQDVAMRLAKVSLVIMARLLDLQGAGKLTAAAINAYVWSLADQAQAS
jgi:hypothetical protein